MVVLSFLLVIVAAVTLIIGLFQDTLAWIWTSIASCVVAMIFLGIGVLQRRGRQPEAAGGPAPGHGAAASGPSARSPDQPVDVSAVPKRTADEARAAVEQAEGDVETAAAVAREPEHVVPDETPTEPVAEEPVAAEVTAAPEPEAASADAAAVAREPERVVPDETPTEPVAEEPVAAEVTAAPEAASADAAPPVRSADEKRTTWAPAEGTTGARARAALAGVKGLGPAKQQALLDRFGSLEAIATASKDELLEVKGIGQQVAEEIRSTLRSADI